ncbi:hypothetical protein ACKKBG_A15830 [Auxenochlorella protothecoides x Auxenochlorella symbiontica]|uniref:VTT domain-containing protein n=1 Tax=Auxenochlorella protothecoides TaxID=3075 RepID=A0A1D1ZZQ2_AUXPR
MGPPTASRWAWLRSVNWSRLALGLALLSGMILAYAEFDAARLEAVLIWLQGHKLKGGALFVLGFTLGVVLMLPAMVMGMAAGAVFGILPGTLLAWLGCSLGQVLAFIIGRYLLRDPVTAYLTRQFPAWTAIDAALGSEAWKLVTLLRLSPLAPWNVLNYALAVTAVPLGPYAAASAAAVLPYLALFVYAGSLARSLADVLAGDTGLDAGATLGVALASGALMLAAVWYTTHVSRRAIARTLLRHGDGLPPELTTDADVVALLQVASFGEEGAEEGAAGHAAGGLSPHWLSPRARPGKAERSDAEAVAAGTASMARDVELGALLPEGRAAVELDARPSRAASPLRSPGPRASGSVTPVYGARQGARQRGGTDFEAFA